MSSSLLDKLVTYNDFPIKGVEFIDISPILNDRKLFDKVITNMCNKIKSFNIKRSLVIVAIDARGFIFGSAVASRLKCRLVLARKSGKLPGECYKTTSESEYSTETYEVEKLIKKTDNVVVIDDVIATGNSMLCISRLIRDTIKAKLYGTISFININKLSGLELLSNNNIESYSVVNI